MGFEIGAILAGVGAGVTFSLSAYFKKKDQDFQWGKFGSTLVVGAIAGAVSGFLDMPVGAGYDYVASLGLTPLIENGFKIVTRKVFGW